VADLNADNARAVAKSLQDAGARAADIALDVGDPGSAAAACERAVQAFGRLDVLVNNAAVDFTLPIDELSLAQFDSVLRVNLRGAFVMAQLAAKRMKALGGGQIVNIASTAA
jgi:NAD(P)-dependent dehydrogenase (short-subunit alcohol dehydrogenase family)